MLREWVVLLAACAAAHGGDPQCPTGYDSCVAQGFGGVLSLALIDALPSAEANGVLCRPQAQDHLFDCHLTCALRLVVTSPPEHAFTACLFDNSFAPYSPAAHIDEKHPLRKKELPMVYVPRGGCDPRDYSREKHAGNILVFLFEELACDFSERMPLAASAGAAAVVMLYVPSNKMTAHFPLTGRSDGFETLPATVLGGQYSEVIKDAMFAKNLPVRGYLDLACDASPATPPPTLPVTDNCPSLSLVGKCSNQADPEHRLCNRCPQQLSWGGKSVCLWGNGLVPRDGRNHLKSVLSLPADVKAVYLETSKPDWLGCSIEDFRNLSGAVVFASYSSSGSFGAGFCSPFRAAWTASQAGVLAFVSISPRDSVAVAVEGPAEFIDIPVHTTMAADFATLESILTQGERRVMPPERSPPLLVPLLRDIEFPAVTRYTLSVKITDDAAADPYVPPVAAPPGLSLARSTSLNSFEWSLTVIIACSLVGCLCVLIAWQIRRQRKEHSSAAFDEKFTVPLSVASMGLSISLVLIIAAVAFALAHTAGQSATDTALDDGRTATMQTYRSAQDNVQNQARHLTKAVTGRVQTRLLQSIETGEQAAQSVAKLYRDTDSTWISWNSKYQSFVDLSFPHCCRDSYDWNLWFGGLSLSTTSVNGFYADHKMKTDDRENVLRRDGLNHVNVTNDGSLYGLTLNLPVGTGNTQLSIFPTFAPGLPDNPGKRIGLYPGDKRAVIAGRSVGHITWMFQLDALPWNTEAIYWYPPNPISLLTPVYSRMGVYLGVVEAMMDSSLLMTSLQAALADDAALQNITIAVFDATTSIILADTNNYFSRVLDQYYTIGTYTPHRQYIQLHESLAIEYNALHHHLTESHEVGHEMTGSGFDQAVLYTRTSYHVFDVRASSSGGVTDVSGNVHGVENQGGSCGDCTAPRELWDGRTGEVMVFDGANSMLIYQNLTTDVPHVAATRRGSGAWDSSVPLYQTVRPLAGVGGGAEQQCVVRADLFTPFVKCMLRGHYFDKPYAIVARFKPSADVSEADRTQQIFTEASVGETTVRMYANGAVVLNVLSYGCSTKPVEGGTKGGEWVSVAFVRTATNCTTFVNGKLWDTNRIVNGLKSDPQGVPFEIGRGFVGEISSVQMLNVTVNAKEATGLHENDVFVRDVPSKTWLLETGRIRREDTSHTGLDWIVATMMPRDDVMRRVDENNRVMLHNLEVQEDNTKTKLQQKTTETIIVILAIALASVFVFLVFNDLLTRPFAQVCVVMEDAAVMRIEEIPDISSRILEINSIHRAMVLMSRNLKEYKAYLPQALLCEQLVPDDDSDGEWNEECSPLAQGNEGKVEEWDNLAETSNSVIKLGASESSARESSARESNAREFSQRDSSARESSVRAASVEVAKADAPPSNPLARTHDVAASDSRRRSFGRRGRRGMNPSRRDKDDVGDAGVEAPVTPVGHNNIATGSSGNQACDEVDDDSSRRSRSMSLSESTDCRPGGRVRRMSVFKLSLVKRMVTLVHVNLRGFHRAERLVDVHTEYLSAIVSLTAPLRGIIDDFYGDHVTVSFNTSCVVSEHRLSGMNLALAIKAKFPLSGRLAANCAFSCGRMIFGSLGCDGHKKCCIVAEHTVTVRSMERLGRSFGVAVVTDSNTAAELRYSATFAVVCRVAMRDASTCMLMETVRKKERAKTAEWMYELQSDVDPFKEYNTVAQDVYRGNDTEDALRALADDPCVKPQLDRLQAIITSFAPGPVQAARLFISGLGDSRTTAKRESVRE